MADTTTTPIADTAHTADGHHESLYAGGIWSWITTVDHKRIGVMYFCTAMFWLVIAGTEAILIRIQLFSPGNDFVSARLYNQLFTMHGTTMIFMVAMPMAVAFFNFIVPLQIGARDVAFPRLNALSYWIYLFGSIYMNFSWFLGEAPETTWVGYANITSSTWTPGLSVDFWLIGLSILGVASIAGGVNFITTIIQLRAPGMKLMRMPMFTWMTLVTSFLLITALPVIAVALILLGFDRFFGANFYNVAAGGDPVLWQHLFWIFGHPEVYILILPSFGIISDVLPTFSKKPLFGYPMVAYAGIVIGFIGWGVWSHHMFTVGLGPIADSFFVASTMVIAIPTAVKIFNWIGTMWGGSLKFTTAMLFSIGLVAEFTIGGLSGIMHAAAPVDLQQHDSYFVVAHFHYVIAGGVLMGLFAGMYYWYPKVTGRYMSEKLGKWHFWLGLFGFNLTFFPMHFSGMYGMPRRTWTYQAELGLEFWNQITTVGGFIFGFSSLILVYNLIWSRKNGKPAPADSWGGHTLEWAIPSPPHHYNFPKVPTVRSKEPMWHDAEREEILAATMTEPDKEPHMPNGSYWPIVVAAGISMTWIALHFDRWYVPPIFLVLTLVAITMWTLEDPFAHDGHGEAGGAH